MKDEADRLNKLIKNQKKANKENLVLSKVYNLFFDNAIPLTAYPNIEGCLGLLAGGSRMRIREGYVVMSFDYDVKPVYNDCLFNMKERLDVKELGMVRNAADANDRNENQYNEIL